MGKICVTITEPDQLTAAAHADLVELRLDYLGADGWEQLAARTDKPVIVTYRRRDQGGARRMGDVPEAERLAVLARALTHQSTDRAAYVDVEHGCEDALPAERRAKLIISHHDFTGMPPDLSGLCGKLAIAGADVVKVAVTPDDALDQLTVYRALRACREIGQEAVIVGMGEFGQATRILGLREGAAWTYAAPTAQTAAAPGQLTVHELNAVYRARSISPATEVYAVIGDPIAHSLSPTLHNAAFAHLGLDAVYVPFRVKNDPAGFVRAMREIPISGFSVTIPHKQAVRAALDAAGIDADARSIGAVNTIAAHNKNGRLAGSNSDQAGALAPLVQVLARQEQTLAGARVCVLGAGGAARAVVHGLVRAGADVTIANRTVSKAEALAQELGGRGVDLAETMAMAMSGEDFAVLINTTPVGMHPDVEAMPVAPEALRPGMVVFDMVYNPLDTLLLRTARERGCRTLDGLAMFVAQGAAQFKLWTGRDAPVDVMRQACLERLRGRQEA